MYIGINNMFQLSIELFELIYVISICETD